MGSRTTDSDRGALRNVLSTMRSRMLAVMIAVSVCFVVASGIILWSLLGMGRALSDSATHTSEELVPVLHIEGEVRKAEFAGWTAAFGMYQGAPVFVRGDYDDLAADLDAAFANLHAGEQDRFAEEAVAIHAAEEHWALAKDGYEAAFKGDFANDFLLADYLGDVSAEIDSVVSALDEAQSTELAEQTRAVLDSESQKTFAIWLAAGALLIGLAMMFAISKILLGGVVGAIAQLRDAARRLASGEWGHRVDVEGSSELADLGKAFNTMSDRLRQSHTELEHRALHDQLTGLGNRNLIGDRLEHASATRDAQKRTDAFLVIDLDHFKDINDTRGHALGDAALMAVARHITRCVRDTDTVARLGGDEFGVLLEGINGLVEAEVIAKRILDTIATPSRLLDVDVIIKASIGIASATQTTTTTELISSADLAMYEAKRAGGSTWRVFDETLRTALTDRVQLEADLRAAITDDQIEIAYQAVYDIQSNRAIGVEALARWTHPIHGPASPGRFIPLAERAGLIAELGWNILNRACSQVGSWQSKYPDLDNFSLAINIAAPHLEEHDFVERVIQTLNASGVAPVNLVLEITETMMIQRGAEARQKLQQLREHGISISVDDFGTGYSSLGQLRDYPADSLKIDREFVTDIDKDADKRALTRTIIELAKNLDLPCIAEGIETPGELAVLRDLNCKFAQGFFLHIPSPALGVEDLFRTGTLV